MLLEDDEALGRGIQMPVILLTAKDLELDGFAFDFFRLEFSKNGMSIELSKTEQLRAMLVWEGLLYALGAAGLALVPAVALGPVTFRAVEGLFWFFTYRLTLTPFLLVIPLFALLGAGIPVPTVRLAARHTIVERLREE